MSNRNLKIFMRVTKSVSYNLFKYEYRTEEKMKL